MKTGTPYSGEALEEAKITMPSAVRVYLQKMEGRETDPKALKYAIEYDPLAGGVPSPMKEGKQR